METWTGKQVDVLWLTPDDIRIEDIARSLSMQTRFGGHIDKFYSVANHCVLMAEFFFKKGEYRKAKYALLHEGDEVFLGDLITPIKYLDEMAPYRELGKSIQRTVLRRFGLYGTVPKAVKTLDDRMKIAEARKVKPNSNLAREEIDTSDIKIRVYTQKVAEKKFLQMYRTIEEKINCEAV